MKKITALLVAAALIVTLAACGAGGPGAAAPDTAETGDVDTSAQSGESTPAGDDESTPEDLSDDGCGCVDSDSPDPDDDLPLPPADAGAQTNPTPDAADDTAPDPSPDPAPSENPAPQVAGGWQKAESPSLTDKQYEVFDKAMSAYEGESKYVPFAYLASQVVAGVNHRFLCLTPGMQSEFNREYAYSVVTVYEDLKGGAVITDVLDSGYFINFAEMPGGWSSYGPAIDEELKDSFDKAAKAKSLTLTPVALLAEQVVGGMNYLVFCEDGPSYAFANLFLDNYGNAEISGVSRVS